MLYANSCVDIILWVWQSEEIPLGARWWTWSRHEALLHFPVYFRLSVAIGSGLFSTKMLASFSRMRDWDVFLRVDRKRPMLVLGTDQQYQDQFKYEIVSLWQRVSPQTMSGTTPLKDCLCLCKLRAPIVKWPPSWDLCAVWSRWRVSLCATAGILLIQCS